jgi:hypothetical protein
MDYRTFEASLAELHRVRPDGLGKFRSRLRVLRDMGVPSVEKPGKGSKVQYQFFDLWEVHLGLHLEHFGLPPARVAFVLEDNARAEWHRMMRERETDSKGDIWAEMRFFRFQAAATKDDRYSWVYVGPSEEVFDAIRKTETKSDPAMVIGLVNLSQMTRECEAMLAKHS